MYPNLLSDLINVLLKGLMNRLPFLWYIFIVGLRITNEKSGKLRSDKMINKDFLFF